MSWEDRAACRDRPDLSWFPVAPMGRGPKSEHHDAVAAAIAVCQTCPVINECREAGRTESGIWGGEYHTEEAIRKKQDRNRRRVRTPSYSHGTPAGYRQHMKRNTTPCDGCVAAYEREQERAARAAEKRTQAHLMAKGMPELVAALLESIRDELTPGDQGECEMSSCRGELQSADGEVAA